MVGWLDVWLGMAVKGSRRSCCRLTVVDLWEGYFYAYYYAYGLVIDAYTNASGNTYMHIYVHVYDWNSGWHTCQPKPRAISRNSYPYLLMQTTSRTYAYIIVFLPTDWYETIY